MLFWKSTEEGKTSPSMPFWKSTEEGKTSPSRLRRATSPNEGRLSGEIIYMLLVTC